ncbi:MAG TPA: VOC family protein [Acidimicrobiales bacterium]|jgi:PhnB protein|nr:VOC family protein [Acidimicrobiales bacterium]
MAFHPYLMFGGNCRQALTRYQEVFGGDLQIMTMAEMPGDDPMKDEHPDIVMHGALTFDDNLLMASDDPTGGFDGVRGIHVSYSTTDATKAQQVFDGLAEGGTVTMPLAETFWAPAFGMCVDRFGIPWMVNVEGAPPAS